MIIIVKIKNILNLQNSNITIYENLEILVKL
jgi:hypothetical protein